MEVKRQSVSRGSNKNSIVQNHVLYCFTIETAEYHLPVYYTYSATHSWHDMCHQPPYLKHMAR